MTVFYNNDYTVFFLLSVVFGVALKLLYDLSEIICTVNFKNKIIKILSDVSFCVAFAIMTFIFTYCLNDGNYRWFEFFGIFLGIYLCSHTLSVLLNRFYLFSIRVLKKIYCFILIMIFNPLDKLNKRCKILIEEQIKKYYERVLLRQFQNTCKERRKTEGYENR